jgi:hypothetical protein
MVTMKTKRHLMRARRLPPADERAGARKNPSPSREHVAHESVEYTIFMNAQELRKLLAEPDAPSRPRRVAAAISWYGAMAGVRSSPCTAAGRSRLDRLETAFRALGRRVDVSIEKRSLRAKNQGRPFVRWKHQPVRHSRTGDDHRFGAGSSGRPPKSRAWYRAGTLNQLIAFRHMR